MKEHSKPSDRLPCSICCDMFLEKNTINIMIEPDYAFRKWILQQWDECSCYMLDHWIWQYFVFLLQCSKHVICFIRLFLRKFQEKVPLLQFPKSKSSEIKFIWNLIEAQQLECFERASKILVRSLFPETSQYISFTEMTWKKFDRNFKEEEDLKHNLDESEVKGISDALTGVSEEHALARSWGFCVASFTSVAFFVPQEQKC